MKPLFKIAVAIIAFVGLISAWEGLKSGMVNPALQRLGDK